MVTFDIDIFTFKKNELLICETNTLKKSDQKQITITTTKQLIPLDWISYSYMNHKTSFNLIKNESLRDVNYLPQETD